MTGNDELLRRLSTGDKNAFDEIVEQNMGLVYSVAGRFVNRHCENEDLVQIGAIGLIKAAKRFDASFGVKFSTYAVPMIIGEIRRFLRDDGSIKVSRAVKETAVKGKYAEEQLRRRLGRNPTLKEISAETGIDEDLLSEAFDASASPQSLQAELGNDDNGIGLIELIASEDTEEKIVDRVFLKEALAALSAREYNIIVMRYFRGRTQSEIAGEIGISQVQVSRIEKKAILKMRESVMT